MKKSKLYNNRYMMLFVYKIAKLQVNRNKVGKYQKHIVSS